MRTFTKKTTCNCLDFTEHLPRFAWSRKYHKKTIFIMSLHHGFNRYMVDENGWKHFHYFAKQGSYENIKFLADGGININLKTNKGRNCLHIAASNKHLKLCKLLVKKHNFSVHETDNNGWTALHVSAQSGNFELVKFFVEKGTDIHLSTDDGKNCLHIAASNGNLNLCRKLILKHNSDVHLTDENGWKALHYSAKSGNYRLVKYFVNKGTDIHLLDYHGRNCLHIAAKNGHINLCKKLVEKHNLDVLGTDNDGMTALHFSAASGTYELFRFLVDKGTDPHLQSSNGKKNCLHIAANSGHLNFCKTIIDKHNFNVERTDSNGWAALHFSAANGSYELFKLLADNETDIHLPTNDGQNCLHIATNRGHLNFCKTLIDKHNFNVKRTDSNGWAALHFSAASGSYELFKFLADKQTDIHLSTNDGQNCLHIAANRGHLNFCKTLIDKHNFNVKRTDSNGWAALHFSAASGSYELFKFLADKETDIHLSTNDGQNCLHIAAHNGHVHLCAALIVKHNFDVHGKDNNGQNALHLSVYSESYVLFKCFEGTGIDIKVLTNQGRTCLHIAARQGHLNLCKKLINRHNFDEKKADTNGWTALHFSVESGNYELVKFIARAYTDIFLPTNDGQNCFYIAMANRHFHLSRVLREIHFKQMSKNEETERTALLFAAEKGSYECIRLFVTMGINIHVLNNDGRNSLHIAAFNGHFTLCKELVEKHKFDVHETDNGGWTAVHLSAWSDNYELFTFLIDKGADTHLTTNDGQNCLHTAALGGSLNVCKKLINKHNFDVEVTDNNGWTALHCSAANGSYELFTFLIDKGADIHVKANYGQNCLHTAARCGHLSLCKKLINKHNFNVEVTDNDGWAALHCSAANGNYELFKFLVDKVADVYLPVNDGKNCLHIAARGGHLNLCKKLIDKQNFDVEITDNDGWTALHYSAKSGNSNLFKFITSMSTDIDLLANDGRNCLHIAALEGHLGLCMELLQKYKFDERDTDDYGWKALHFSAVSGSYELVHFFGHFHHYSGQKIHFRTSNGENCLHIAAYNGHFDLCKALTKFHDFKVNVTDNFGWTALHSSILSSNYQLFRFLSGFGNDIHVPTNAGVNCLHIAADKGYLNICEALIDKHNFDVYAADNEGWTALHFSAQNGSYELVKFFVDKGTDINLKTSSGLNCLHIGAFHEHLSLCEKLIDKHKFDVNISDNDGWTALLFSAKSGNFDLFRLLLEKGSEFYCKTDRMENVLHLSALNGHYDICEFVLEYFAKDFNDNNIKKQYALDGKLCTSQIFYKYDTIFLHAMDVDGNTYLHLAADANQFRICELLLKYDIEVTTLSNKRDDTAMDIAQENNHEDVLNVLKGHFDRTGNFFRYFI